MTTGTWPFLTGATNQVNPYLWGLISWSRERGRHARAVRDLEHGVEERREYYWKVTTAGSLGSTEPVWTAGPVGTVITSGTAQLTCTGTASGCTRSPSRPSTRTTSRASLSSCSGPRMARPVSVAPRTSSSVANRYSVGIGGWDVANGMIVTGIVLTFGLHQFDAARVMALELGKPS